ncbi:hypothetical protein E1301_Tti014277 [Triplophysa tibetana]|uniref:Uncharacterized protein n=1 Tax=Triplophysa tibetana TaxID=1572043 RepID=A0A5A9PI50_9TELE|nr:hypothetical protein E1301_Tti014277 [Triplophysa tibetana]
MEPDGIVRNEFNMFLKEWLLRGSSGRPSSAVIDAKSCGATIVRLPSLGRRGGIDTATSLLEAMMDSAVEGPSSLGEAWGKPQMDLMRGSPPLSASVCPQGHRQESPPESAPSPSCAPCRGPIGKT